MVADEGVNVTSETTLGAFEKCPRCKNKKVGPNHNYCELCGLKLKGWESMNIITELGKYLERAQAAQGNDERLAVIMTDMERCYNIPIVGKRLMEWEEKTPYAERIIKTYRYISNLRTL